MACTAIELISKQHRPYWGRTQDFEQHFEYSGVKVPKGYVWQAAATPFESKLNVMGIVWANDIHQSPVLLDGINDYGICGGSFYFDHFYRYVSTETIQASGKVAIRGEELCTWILTHYKSITDIKNNLEKDVGITNEAGYMMGMSVPQHCVFIDKEGRSIVVEPSKPNGFRIFDNPLGVMTNAPTFDWHLNNLKTWLERITKRSYKFDDGEPINQISMDESTSGLVGVPADYKPESRFLRAAVNKLMSIETDDDETLNQIFQLLSAENTPKGSLRIYGEKDTLVAWTQYTAGYDIQKKQLYAFTYDNQNLRLLDFGDPTDWAPEMEYFSFISKPQAEPFTPKNEWQPGENTI